MLTKLIRSVPGFRSLASRIWAGWMTACSITRYFKGVRERRKMGMSHKEASDRSYNCEMKKIDDMMTESRNRVMLMRRRGVK